MAATKRENIRRLSEKVGFVMGYMSQRPEPATDEEMNNLINEMSEKYEEWHSQEKATEKTGEKTKKAENKKEETEMEDNEKTVYVVYEEEYNHDGTEKKKELLCIEQDEASARIEINERIELWHTMERINNPWMYCRTAVIENGVIFRRINHDGYNKDRPMELKFWYEPAKLVL